MYQKWGKPSARLSVVLPGGLHTSPVNGVTGLFSSEVLQHSHRLPNSSAFHPRFMISSNHRSPSSPASLPLLAACDKKSTPTATSPSIHGNTCGCTVGIQASEFLTPASPRCATAEKFRWSNETATGRDSSGTIPNTQAMDRRDRRWRSHRRRAQRREGREPRLPRKDARVQAMDISDTPVADLQPLKGLKTRRVLHGEHEGLRHLATSRHASSKALPERRTCA